MLLILIPTSVITMFFNKEAWDLKKWIQSLVITIRETFRVTSGRKSIGSGVRRPRIVIPALPFTNWVSHSKDFTFLNLIAPTYKMVLPDLPTSQDCCECHKGYTCEAVLGTVQSHTPWSSLSLLPILCLFAVFFSFLWSFSSFPQKPWGKKLHGFIVLGVRRPLRSWVQFFY